MGQFRTRIWLRRCHCRARGTRATTGRHARGTVQPEDSRASRSTSRHTSTLAEERPTCLFAHCRFVALYKKSTKTKAAIVRFEQAVIEGGPIVLPGAQALLSQIDAGSSPSARGWTIVTSGKCPIFLVPQPHSHLLPANLQNWPRKKINRNHRNKTKSSHELLYPASTRAHRHTSARSGLRDCRRR